jgi:hypothetical protein
MTAAPIPSRTGLALPMVLAVWLFLFSAQEAGAEKIARSASLVCSVEPRAMFPLGASGMSAIGSVVPHRLTLLTLHHATGPIDRYDPASLSLVGRAAGFPEMQFDNPPTFGSIDRCGALEAPMTSAPLMYDWAPLLSVSQTLFATKPRVCPGNSFTANTQIVMADGSRKAISELTVGDYVIATDPGTGRTAVREVTAVHLNLDTAFADVTIIDTDGDVSTINTTQHHSFWSVSDHKWTDAMELERGDYLRSADGSLLTVASVRTFEGNQWMWDLTIDDIHTFYVANGEESVLVHNCGETVYRGAKAGEVVDFDARPGIDFKVDADGYVKPGRGVSLNSSPEVLAKYGREAHEVVQSSLPDGLEIIHTGGTHYEVVVRQGVRMTPAEYQGALCQIMCTPKP